MNQIDLIKIKEEQPVAKISDIELEFLIKRDFPDTTALITRKLKTIQSDSQEGKNRIAAAVLKLSKSDPGKIDPWIKAANEDFRDVISLAEYPRASKHGFEKHLQEDIKSDYLDDWTEYLEWKNRTK